MSDYVTSATDPATAYELPLLEELLLRPRWHQDALCREYPQLDFFPEPRELSGDVVAVCGRCLVRPECLSTGLAGNERGIWGGTTESLRVRMRRRKAEAA
jgi:WhiB family redox-sensing transcriptional regulator